MLEVRQRKVQKGGVVTTDLPAGQTATVVRLDERTELVSLEPAGRIREMIAALEHLDHARSERHSKLIERLRGQSHAASLFPRAPGPAEEDRPLDEAEADLFATRTQNRRPF